VCVYRAIAVLGAGHHEAPRHCVKISVAFFTLAALVICAVREVAHAALHPERHRHGHLLPASACRLHRHVHGEPDIVLVEHDGQGDRAGVRVRALLHTSRAASSARRDAAHQREVPGPRTELIAGRLPEE
jgi:hypothetical protein